ncbi:histone-lysine N-methyltransferase SETMAR [Plakobranchus ocellatus]|uniref:Histone-lysine N-methyltransferase SETMAR n=1 Tax=Plakobranchus ocellatus TaxID=259542 RepID=A0AAV4CXU9_9GAST|nr:histone-lysine N-methyltransferase SETMAR [Plakobranchus ocellatus]
MVPGLDCGQDEEEFPNRSAAAIAVLALLTAFKKQVETEDDLSELRNWFDNFDVDFFRVGINSLLSRWQKCIDLQGDYVEK